MIRIVADSGAHLPPEVRQELDIATIPLLVIFGSHSYRDEVDITNEQFYEKLRHEKVHPTTSTPAPADFINVWRPIIMAGDEIVCITLPSVLSATHATALVAKKQMEQEAGHPLPISIVDSRWVSTAEGFQAIVGARAARSGKNRDEIVQAITALDERMRLIFLLDTVEYLRRGGRIGNGTAFMGAMLGIKPLFQIANGEVDPLERARSRKAGLAKLVEFVSNPPPINGRKPLGNGPLHVAVLHAGAPDDAQYLENELRARYNVAEMYRAHIGPVIAVHSGPKGVGLAFYRE